MSYSYLAVHCTNLCCDVLQEPSFEWLSHDVIDGLHQDFFESIKNNSNQWSKYYTHQDAFIDSVARGVIKALHLCKFDRAIRNPEWLLTAMQSRIDFSIKLYQ